MDDLYRRRNELKQRLQEIKNEEIKRKEMNALISSKIASKKELIVENNNNIDKLYKNITLADETILILSEKIEKYKEKHFISISERLRVIKNQLETFKFSRSIKIFNEFTMISKLISETEKFPRLQNKITNFYRNSKEKLKNNLINYLETTIFDYSKLHNYIFAIHVLINYENHFKEKIFIDFLVQKLTDEFLETFIENQSQKRLDKPEWFFEYLSDKILQYSKLLDLYENAKSAYRKSCMKNREEIIPSMEKTAYSEFGKKIVLLVNIKYNEILQSESPQKHNLIVHFCNEFISFKEEVLKETKIPIYSVEIAESLLAIENDKIIEKLHDVYSSDPDKWFPGCEKILNELISLGITMQPIEKSLLTNFISFFCREVVRCFQVLIDKLRFVSDDEKEMLCTIFQGIENLKKLLIEQGLEAHELHGYELFDISELVNLNRNNLNIIKTLIGYETERMLKRLGNFEFVNERLLVDIVMGYRHVVELYRKYFGMAIFSDTKVFISENLIKLMKNRLNSEQFLLLKEFYKEITAIIGDLDAGEYLEALEDLFNGNERKDKIYRKLKNLYE